MNGEKHVLMIHVILTADGKDVPSTVYRKNGTREYVRLIYVSHELRAQDMHELQIVYEACD